MSITRTLFRYAARYKGLIAANAVSNVLMVAFSVASIPALEPFLRILFQQGELTTVKPAWAWSPASVTGNFNFWFSELIRDRGYEVALLYMCGLIVFVFFGKNLFRYLSVATLAPLRSNVVRDLRQDLFAHVARLPVGYFTEQRRGDLLSRFTADVQEVEYSVLNSVQQVVQNPLLIVGALAIMLFISAKLTLFTVALLGITGVVIGGISRRLRRQSTAVQEGLGDLTAQIDETIGGLRVVKAFTAEDYVAARFGESNTRYRDALVRLLRRRDLSSPLSEFLGIVVVVALIYYGFRQIQTGAIDVATFITFIYAFFSTIEPSKKFSNAFYNIQRGRSAFDRIAEVFKTPNPIAERSAGKASGDAAPPLPPPLRTGLELHDVTFTYANAERPALRGVSFRMPVGKVTALVGASGAGKSTIADLLPRFYDVDGGRVTLDGRDLRDLDLAGLRAMISVVSQDVVLFNDTIAANIAFGVPDATPARIEAAAREANAHDFILAQPQGYHTPIGDRGARLSGGQRQRLTIARALLRDAPILVLDEATSALDAESERAIQAALLRLMQGRTCLVIAHRMATIQHADEIIVLDAGRVIERGDHASLLERGGTYAKLIELQSA